MCHLLDGRVSVKHLLYHPFISHSFHFPQPLCLLLLHSQYHCTNPNQTLPLCYLHLVAASAPTSAQDGLDPVRLALVFSCHQLAQRSHLHLLCTVSVTCVGGVFLCQLAHCLRCTHYLHPFCCYPLQLALVVSINQSINQSSEGFSAGIVMRKVGFSDSSV